MIRASRDRLFAALATAALLIGCESRDEPASPSTPPTATAPAAQPPADLPPPWLPSPDRRTARFLGYEGPKPATWEEFRPQNRLRVANWVIPGRDGSNQGHVVVFDLGAAAIDLAANIELWRSRFRPDAEGAAPEPRVTEAQTVTGLPVTFVEMRGDYVRSGAQWYTSDQVLLVAVVETPDGAVHIRLTAETATAEAHRKAFRDLVLNLRPEG